MTAKVLITAGAAGIGLEIGRAFAASGASVFTCDIDDAALERARSEVPGLKAIKCDVGEPAQVEAMVAQAAEELGGLDVLVNNAGIGGPTKSVRDLALEDWEAVIRINLTGAFNVTRAAIPHLVNSENGVIINMSSAAGRFGYPNRSPYSVTKWGLIGFTKTLSMELGGDNIRVNAIAPGAVDGERIQRVFKGRSEATGKSVEEIKEESMANQSIKRLVDPEEIGALAVFLASDAARSISGQVIPIDNDYQRN